MEAVLDFGRGCQDLAIILLGGVWEGGALISAPLLAQARRHQVAPGYTAVDLVLFINPVSLSFPSTFLCRESCTVVDKNAHTMGARHLFKDEKNHRCRRYDKKRVRYSNIERRIFRLNLKQIDLWAPLFKILKKKNSPLWEYMWTVRGPGIFAIVLFSLKPPSYRIIFPTSFLSVSQPGTTILIL